MNASKLAMRIASFDKQAIVETKNLAPHHGAGVICDRIDGGTSATDISQRRSVAAFLDLADLTSAHETGRADCQHDKDK